MGIAYKIGDGSTLPIKIGLARPVADYHSAWRIRHPETRDWAQTVPSWDLYHELAYIFFAKYDFYIRLSYFDYSINSIHFQNQVAFPPQDLRFILERLEFTHLSNIG